MNHDPIVDEVRRARERLAATCDYDLDRIFDEIQRRQATETAPVVSFAKPSSTRQVSSVSGARSD